MTTLAAMAMAIAAALLAPPGQPTGVGAAETPAMAASTVGIEGRVLLRVPAGRSLVALPADRATPVVLRIADSAVDGDSAIYDVRFIAQYPGRFDLREYLEYGDGSAAADLDPVVVEIGSLLPETHTGDLFGTPSSPLPTPGGYRALLIAGGVVWLVPVGWVVVRRLRTRPAQDATEAGPARTLGDQLRPLVEAAMRGELSTERSAELEMLLLAYWRRHRRLEGLSHKEAIATLREDEEAGGLLRAMDEWLHRAPGDASAVDVSALLARYREIERIELPGRPGLTEAGRADAPRAEARRAEAGAAR